MGRNTLRSIIRLRRQALDQAARDLMQSLQAEKQAAARLADVEVKIAHEMQAATNLARDDFAVEAFGRWLKRAREETRHASDAHQRASAEALRARAQVSAARAALEVAEALELSLHVEQRVQGQRDAQRDTDETAQNVVIRANACNAKIDWDVS